MDDCSPDNSIAILKEVIEEYPQRKPHVTIYSFPENNGLPTARNFLVEHCKTDWLMHVDSDDWIEHDLVEELVKKQFETGADMVISGVCCHMKGRDYSSRFLDSDQKEDFLKLVFSSWDWNNVWGILIRHSVYTDNNIHVSTGFYSGEDLRTVFKLMYYANRIVGTRKDGYHYDRKRENRISELDSSKARKVYSGYVGSLEEVRSFIKEKMPEYLELFDTDKCLIVHSSFLYHSVIFSDKQLHRVVSEHHRDIIHRYPSLRGGFKDRLKREARYHYWIAHPIIQWHFVLLKILRKM